MLSSRAFNVWLHCVDNYCAFLLYSSSYLFKGSIVSRIILLIAFDNLMFELS